MRIQPTPFHCISCHAEWVGEVIADAPAHAVIAVLRALRCPECGIGPKRIAFGRGDAARGTPGERASVPIKPDQAAEQEEAAV